MTIVFKAKSTGLAVSALLRNPLTLALAQTVTLPNISIESVPTLFYSALPTGLAAGRYIVEFTAGGVVVDSDGDDEYLWDGTKEITAAVLADAIANVSAGGGATLTDITTVVESAKDAVITRGDSAWATATGFNSVAPDNTGIGTLLTRLSDARATKLDTVATTANAATFKATGYATPANVTSVITAGDARWATGATAANITAAQSAIIARGDSAWATATGFNTVAPDNGTLTALANKFDVLLTADDLSFNSTALQFAPTGSGGTGGGLTSGQADQLTTLFGLIDGTGDAFTAEALANAPTGGTVDLSAIAKTSELTAARDVITDAIDAKPVTPVTDLAPVLAAIDEASPDVNLTPITDAITASQSAIITRGNEAWATATGFNSVAPDNAGILQAIADKPVTPIADLSPVLTAIDGIESAPDLTPVTDAVSTAQSAIITRGDIAWKTATITATGDVSIDLSPVIEAIDALNNGITPRLIRIEDKPVTPVTDLSSIDTSLTNLATLIASVQADAAIASKDASNDAFLDVTTAIVTIYEADGVTPAWRYQLTDANGIPSVVGAVKKTRIANI